MKQKLRRKIKRLRNKLQKSDNEKQDLLNKHEPEIVELVAVAPAGSDQMLRAGYTADGRWVSRIEIGFSK